MNLLSWNEFLDNEDHFRLVMTLGEWAYRVKKISQKGSFLRCSYSWLALLIGIPWQCSVIFISKLYASLYTSLDCTSANVQRGGTSWLTTW
jgi:hypothetical protein